MIAKLEGIQNGYALLRTSTDEEFQAILKQYKDANNLRCVICNNRTAKCFKHEFNFPHQIKFKKLHSITIFKNFQKEVMYGYKKCKWIIP